MAEPPLTLVATREVDAEAAAGTLESTAVDRDGTLAEGGVDDRDKAAEEEETKRAALADAREAGTEEASV